MARKGTPPPAPPKKAPATRAAKVRVSMAGRTGTVGDWDPEAHSVAVEFDDELGVLPNIRVDQLTREG